MSSSQDDYTYEEKKDNEKTKKSADSYHALAGSRDFELSKMSKGNDSVSNSKAELNSSYHRLGSEPTKNKMSKGYPLGDEDNTPVKLVSKEKAKPISDKKTIDDIESFLLEDSEM